MGLYQFLCPEELGILGSTAITNFWDRHYCSLDKYFWSWYNFWYPRTKNKIMSLHPGNWLIEGITVNGFLSRYIYCRYCAIFWSIQRVTVNFYDVLIKKIYFTVIFWMLYDWKTYFQIPIKNVIFCLMYLLWMMVKLVKKKVYGQKVLSYRKTKSLDDV